VQLKTSTAKKEGGAMKVLFEYLVDFVSVPLLPPTIENCKKCAFYQCSETPEGGCIKTDIVTCQIGMKGYFVKNYMREIVDVMSYLEWKKEDELKKEAGK
jgi:hypothetical protein